MGFYFERVGATDWVTIEWGGYPYEIDLDRIPEPLALLQWLVHICGKTWPGTTASEISAFISAVSMRKGWDLWKTLY